MIVCSVPGCINTSKTKGIAFHHFPKELALSKAWIEALGQEGLGTKGKGAVCSNHFLDNDFIGSGDEQILKSDAVPSKQLSNKCQIPDLPVVCRVCLAKGTKMYHIYKHNLDKCFKQATGLKLPKKQRLPPWLCFECARSVVKITQFQKKSLCANTLMLKLIVAEGEISYRNIQSINRKNHHLESNLTIKCFGANYSDLNIFEDEDVKVEQIPETNDLVVKGEEISSNTQEIKIENASYTAEIDDRKSVDIVVEVDKEELDEPGYIEQVMIEDVTNSNMSLRNSHVGNDNRNSNCLRPKRTKAKENKANKNVRKKAKKPSKKPTNNLVKKISNDFNLNDLTMEEQLADIERRKDSLNYNKSPFKCPHCNRGFIASNTYDSHMLRHTNKFGEYICGICKTHYKSKRAVYTHLIGSHVTRYSCKQCEYATTYRKQARAHAKWHKGDTYKCAQCGESFTKQTSYMSHVRIKHPSALACRLCGFAFVSQKGLRQHTHLKHNNLQDLSIPEDGPFCELCNIHFANEDALNQHLRVSPKHTGEGAKVRNDPQSSKKVKALSVEETRIECEQCGMQLEDSMKYHYHFRKMHPDKNRTNYPAMKLQFMCEQCGKFLPSAASLKDHLLLHSGKIQYKCESCDKQFATKARLNSHRAVHGEHRPSYPCHLCGKQFTWTSNRRKHMIIHQGVKPYKCEMCGKAFPFRTEKRLHIAHVHLKEPWPKRDRGKRAPMKRGEAQAATFPEPLAGADMEIL